MRLPNLAAILMLLASAPAERPAAAAPLPDAVSLLRSAVACEDRVPLTGRSVTILWNDRGSQATITREYRSGKGDRRIELLMPRRLRGQILLSRGNSLWRYDPSRHTVLRFAAALEGESVTPLPPGDLKRLLRHYRAEIVPAAETVAGRATWHVRVTGLTSGKVQEQLWIDRKTGIILKQERFHADGEPISSSYFTEITFRAPAPSLFDPRFPAGTRHVGHPRETRPIERAAVEARFGIRVPKRLAEGYDFQGATLNGSGDRRVAHLRYWDGLSAVSLFVAPHGGAVPYGNHAGRKIRLAGGEGRLVTEHHNRVITWRTPQVDCALVGDASEPLLRTLVASTGLVQGARESHHTALLRTLWLAPIALFLFAAALGLGRHLYSLARLRSFGRE
jgi:outer membrane lipoprotein-sorting protein